ncbi:hypothetical protein BJV78DRAFT_544370 [Lactifluus subvellereus]|nr:hypothetical protein BJV78DRAFT_544370 [Lactifluus subvellereus]
MDSVLSVLLSFLRRLRFTGYYIKRFVGRWVLLLAFRGRKLFQVARRRPWPGEPGTSRFRLKPRPTEPSFPCARASTTHSVLGGSAVSREHVVAGSAVPAPVSLHDLEHTPRQTTTATPSASSHMHEPLSPPTDHGSRRGRSSSSIMVVVQDPSTESLSITSSIASDIHEESPQLSPTASSVLSDFYLPEGRFLQMIRSDQIPRYSNAMPILPRSETSYYEVKPLTTVFPYFEEQNP